MHAAIDPNALINAVGDAIVVCDASGAITLWNPAATRMFGFSEAEALGQSLDIIIPERQRKVHWAGYHKTMETGHTRYGNDVLRVPALTRSGATISIAFTVAMLYEANGKVAAIAAVMRDETDRFNRDKAMRRRITDLEALLAGGATVAAPDAPASDAPASGCPAHKA